MLKPRALRVAAAGLSLALALPALAACRSSPDVAAYVGDARVTVAELERAVDERLADEDVAEFAASREADYTRLVLEFLVQREVYEAVAERYDVRVTDGAVRSRIDEIIGDNDAEAIYASWAEQGVTRTDIADSVRQQLVRERIAEAAGETDALSEEALRARYAEVSESLAQPEFGVITVADQATAEAVLAELTADPAAYPTVAARYAGPSTLPQLTRGDPAEIVPVLAERFDATPPGSGFVVPLEVAGGIVVGFTTGTATPAFEEVRPDLEAEARREAEEAGAALVEDVREDLDVTVNPRYGVLSEEGRLVRGEGGVVELLAGATGADAADRSGPGD
ncbi:peptidylprolyl isomerase [Candidatus Blastococcus massiliensis]|uniref:peptidylprolyl isomerase n=1 Tax=Candidatus Blastococcus massiliensis TaxID=1470358 RepID=UPI0004B0EF61|nr:peptidylprolyl isomerase [Candidatus Blastococcus massiliensis]